MKYLLKNDNSEYDVVRMITKSIEFVQPTQAWQRILADSIRDPAELLHILQLPSELLEAAKKAAKNFPLRVPHPYLQRIQSAQLNDPLLKQILPIYHETGSDFDRKNSEMNEPVDAVGDLDAMVIPGLIHKYHGRALLTLTGACAIHCRYCFRRHFPYAQANPFKQYWPDILHYLQEHKEINELILSGGDPLSLTTDKLIRLTDDIQKIEHITSLRIHTRLPIVVPQRIDAECLDWLAKLKFNVIFVVHINHANEIDTQVMQVIQQLRQLQIHVLNQAVLLKGVNDDVTSLSDLSRRCFASGILPYYLHQLDHIQGNHHFTVKQAIGLDLIAKLRASLPGYLVPKYVQEIAGEAAKLPLEI